LDSAVFPSLSAPAPSDNAADNAADNATAGAPDNASEATSGTPPAALAELIAAGLVSHELIGDPAQLEAETPTLATICGLVAGPVYRLDRFHYAFRAGPEDLGGRLGAIPPADWTGALAEALCAAFGPDAIWLTETDGLPEVEEEDGRLDQPLLLLRAEARAVKEALADAPELRAVIQARHAAETARLTARLTTDLVAADLAAGEETPLARHLAALERRQAEILDLLREQAGREQARQDQFQEQLRERLAPLAALAETLPQILPRTLPETLAGVVRRLDTQTARVDGLAERLAGLAAQLEDGTATGARDPAFHETLGLTLAEFLARLERQAADEATPTRVPRFS